MILVGALLSCLIPFGLSIAPLLIGIFVLLLGEHRFIKTALGGSHSLLLVSNSDLKLAQLRLSLRINARLPPLRENLMIVTT